MANVTSLPTQERLPEQQHLHRASVRDAETADAASVAETAGAMTVVPVRVRTTNS